MAVEVFVETVYLTKSVEIGVWCALLGRDFNTGQNSWWGLECLSSINCESGAECCSLIGGRVGSTIPTELDRSPGTSSRLAPRIMVSFKEAAASSVRKRSIYTRRTPFPGFSSSADIAWFHVMHISGGH
jgi:hypothetical protein